MGNDIVELPGELQAHSGSSVLTFGSCLNKPGVLAGAQHQEVVRGVSRQDTGAPMNK